MPAGVANVEVAVGPDPDEAGAEQLLQRLVDAIILCQAGQKRPLLEKPSTPCLAAPSNGCPLRSAASTSSNALLISAVSEAEKHCRLMMKPKVSKWAICSVVNIARYSLLLCASSSLSDYPIPISRK